MTLSRTVTQNIRLVRQALKLSQQTVAKKAGLSLSYISLLERGQRSPNLHTLADIADALDVSPAYLLQELAAGGRRGNVTRVRWSR